MNSKTRPATALRNIFNAPPTKVASEVSRKILKQIYREAAEAGDFVTPDAAILELGKRLNRLLGEGEAPVGQLESDQFSPLPRMSAIAPLREAHHHAVDLFYKAYFPQRGAPPLPEENQRRLLELRKLGLSYGQIAAKLGSTPDPRSKDRIRKRIAAARRRFIR